MSKILATIIILAGGKSSRMGENKAFLELNGNVFIDLIIEKFKAFDDCIIIANDVSLYQYPTVRTIKDIYPSRGPLCGLYTGVLNAKHERCIVVTVDTPFLTSDLMLYLSELSDGVDAVVPIVSGRQQPLCAVYNKSALKEIERLVELDVRKVRSLLESLTVRMVNEEILRKFGEPDLLFSNINTPEDYKEAMCHLSE